MVRCIQCGEKRSIGVCGAYLLSNSSPLGERPRLKGVILSEARNLEAFGALYPMTQQDKLLLKILRGKSDANIPFEPLCQLLKLLGFEERIRGSHHIFSKDDVEEILNLQLKQGKAKAYQVKQVRVIVLKYKLGE